jgi:hypothetical protein
MNMIRRVGVAGDAPSVKEWLGEVSAHRGRFAVALFPSLEEMQAASRARSGLMRSSVRGIGVPF